MIFVRSGAKNISRFQASHALTRVFKMAATSRLQHVTGGGSVFKGAVTSCPDYFYSFGVKNSLRSLCQEHVVNLRIFHMLNLMGQVITSRIL